MYIAFEFGDRVRPGDGPFHGVGGIARVTAVTSAATFGQASSPTSGFRVPFHPGRFLSPPPHNLYRVAHRSRERRTGGDAAVDEHHHRAVRRPAWASLWRNRVRWRLGRSRQRDHHATIGRRCSGPLATPNPTTSSPGGTSTQGPGLVRFVANRGAVVSRLSRTDVQEIYRSGSSSKDWPLAWAPRASRTNSSHACASSWARWTPARPTIRAGLPSTTSCT